MNKNELVLQLLNGDTNLEWEIIFIPENYDHECYVNYSPNNGLDGNYEDDGEGLESILKCAIINSIKVK